jgi:pimeloyl-ACP methyl ester carboxylesterase
MVHGFSSSWEAWVNYLGSSGYLAAVGVPGYAVGDGKVPGTMNTGSIPQPTGRTNTIAENAAILRDYIKGVLEITGAQKVDLLAHSMGGLISRYYIDRFMEEEVAQLIMLGSPMGGTECANLPAALNFYLPAALEIQPLYVNGIFNPQITHRKGIAFHALAGVPIQDTIQSPCTPIPTDLAVSLESVSAIPLNLSQTSILHTELNTSEQVFREFVLPLLQTPAGDFPVRQPDPLPGSTPTKPLQFSRVFTGHIQPGEQQEVVINIEAGISLASFALYDSSRSLETLVQGASGNVLDLDPRANGLIRV